MTARRLCALAAAVALGAVAGGAATPAAAQRGPHATAVVTRREPGSELVIWLTTMGPGAEVWERFGHNAIWVQDTVTGQGVSYNYGLFDFRQTDFTLRFLQGRMWYAMGGFDALPYLESYVRDNRSVWLQELELSPRQKVALRDFLVWNDRDENRHYHYDYYRDNCSTRVRDAIDRVIGGRIRAETDTIAAGATYRSHTQRLTAGDPPIYLGLMLILGEPVDRPLTAYGEMFLPLRLRDWVRQVTVRTEEGRVLPLVRSERLVFRSTRPPVPDAPPRWLPPLLAAGATVGGVFVWLGAAARSRAGARRLFGGLGAAWGAVVGVAGLVLVSVWALSDHVVAYDNENLLQANLLALPLALLLPRLAAGQGGSGRAATLVAMLTAAVSLIGPVLKIVPGFPQVNGQILALFVPIHLGVAVGTWLLARRPLPVQAGGAS